MSRLDKIDKLLRLYEHNPDRAEAEAALKKAGELMRAHIDDPETEAATKNRVADLEQRERDVDKFCRGCGQEKPNHHEACPSHKLEKRISRGCTFGCFSFAGLMFIWFISALVDLVIKLFS